MVIMKDKSKANFPISRIRKIILDNEEIGKINPGAPIIICRGMELFLTEILKSSFGISKKAGSNRITKEHIELAIEKNENFGFLTLEEEKKEN